MKEEQLRNTGNIKITHCMKCGNRLDKYCMIYNGETVICGECTTNIDGIVREHLKPNIDN